MDEKILSVQAGILFEHWVACELFWRTVYLGKGYRVNFWRTVGGAEVDFVLETPDEVIPIEVKYTANPRSEDAATIEHFIGLHPQLAKRGAVICRVKRPEQLSAHVQAIPWHEL